MRSHIVVKFLVLLLITVSIALLASLTRFYWLHSSAIRYRMLDSYIDPKSRKADEERTRHVLFWTRYFEAEFWGMPAETLHQDYLEAISCPVTNCIFTTYKNLLARPHDFDAIVFHGAEEWRREDLPSTRRPHQLYIMATKE
jgi:Fucosyltransferase, N-terminal